MATGRVRIRRYKVRRRGVGGAAIVIGAALLIGALVLLWRSGTLNLSFIASPAPTLSPEDMAADSRTVTIKGGVWYALQLGVFEKDSAAAGMASQYKARGAAGFVRRDGNYRVLAAAYPTRADAQAVQEVLRQRHGIDMVVHEIAIPGLALRMTGQKAQLTALSDGLSFLENVIEHLYTLSQGLDSQSLGGAAVRAALKSEGDTALALESRLRSLFDQKGHQAALRVADILKEIASSLGEAQDESLSEAQLGARVKYCLLLSLTGLGDYAAELAAR